MTSLFLLFIAEWALQLAQNSCVFSMILAHIAHTMLSPIICMHFSNWIENLLLKPSLPNLVCSRSGWLCFCVVHGCANSQGHHAKHALETWLLKPSLPILLCLRAPLLKCLCCANFPRHLAQNALETWLLTPSLPNLLCLRAPLLNMIVVQIPQDILQKMPWRVGC